jgi:sulfofructose kinase
MNARRIVGLGLCVVDHLYVVETLDLSAARTRWFERVVSTGGMACNAIVQAAWLGCNAHLVTAVGDDPEGHALRRALTRMRIKTGRVALSRELSTTVAVVLVARRGGERRFIVPDRRAIERRAPDFDLSLIDRRTLLLVDGHFPRQALRAVKRAREVGATVIGDFSRPRPAILELLRYVDIPIVPLEFAEAYARGDPERALQMLRDRFGGTPVVTLGGKGGLYLREGRVRRYPAHRVAVRDTTGAGDAFHGAFAAALYHGSDFEGAIALARRAAAVCCTALGGTGRLLTRDGVPIPNSRGRAGAA